MKTAIIAVIKARTEKGKWFDMDKYGEYSIRYMGCGKFEVCFQGYDSEISNNGYWFRIYETTQSELLQLNTI